MRPELLGLLKLLLPNSILKLSQPRVRQQPLLWLYIDNITFVPLISIMRMGSLFYKTQALDTNGYEVTQTSLLQQSSIIVVNIFNLAAWGLKTSVITRFKMAQITKPASRLFTGLTWGEREISEMLGINYKNKLDARRLMLDYAFEGTPLRRNFPVAGFEEVEYNMLERWLIYKSAKIRDDFDA